MDNTIHFISGLPRTGSTLLSAILRRNPAFHAAMTSPVLETAVFLDAGQRRALLRGAFTGYYHQADPFELSGLFGYEAGSMLPLLQSSSPPRTPADARVPISN